MADSSRTQQLIEQFRALPADERELALLEMAALTDEHSPAGPLHPDWQVELASRVRSVRDGTASLHDWQEVEQELDDVIKR